MKDYFGNCYQFNKITRMHHSNYLNWEVKGFVPIKTQLKLEIITKGQLKADLNHVDKEFDERQRTERAGGTETI